MLATKTGIRRIVGVWSQPARPNDLRRAREASLRRPRTDHIDLYCLACIAPMKREGP
ncbi:hypothetical protein [Streptomyces eurythermus]|uniref:hypothetical protein n=1 Tax=Streptomyces eurythermus TaxID=42237 RepID=UPI0036D42D08